MVTFILELDSFERIYNESGADDAVRKLTETSKNSETHWLPIAAPSLEWLRPGDASASAFRIIWLRARERDEH